VRIRVVPTASGKFAVQVVSKLHGVLTVHKHVGTYSNRSEKLLLCRAARDFIQETSRQISLLDLAASVRPFNIAVSENQPLFVYRMLTAVYAKLGLNKCPDPLIADLVVARVYAPSSKRETREVLADLFGRRYSLKTVYRRLKTGIESGLKDTFQAALIQFAGSGLGDNLRLVFYDVTTLYFESTARSGIRDFGFSKDHRPIQTQIVVGLVVNPQGFPLYFDVFTGRTFEGHTFLPVVQNIRRLLGNPKLVVIADAAMISQANIDLLVQHRIGFVVGARMANLPAGLIDTVSRRLNHRDGRTTMVAYRGQRLICQYLDSRAARDKSDRLRQIARAQVVVSSPAKLTGRYRFVTSAGSKYSLNSGLITKAEKLEGTKGYLTNTTLSRAVVISRYHDLWRIEKSFRITKSDLEARPIFHRLDETIKAHLVVVFAGLAVSKYIEISAGMSIQKVLKLAGKVLTHKITNTQTGETAYTETTIEDPILRGKIDALRTLGH